MKNRLISAAIVLFCMCAHISALEVYKSELEDISGEEIIFNNYTGPITVYNTMEQIRGIGVNLGESITAGNTTAGEEDRYYVIHTAEENDETGYDADILSIGYNAGVDHIRNLRAIISSYLSTVYGYSQEDADTLATFITVYNAVYRKTPAAFIKKYKPAVRQYLSERRVAISTEYTEWPGNTQILIPLTGRDSGSLSAIDTTIITDDSVVSNIKEESGKGIDIRSDMADLKKREATEAEENAQLAAKNAAEAQVEVQQAKKQVEEAAKESKAAEKDATEAKNEYDLAKAEADANPENAEAQQAAKDAKAEAEAKQKEAEDAAQKALDAKTVLDDAKATAKDQEEKASEEQVFADKKRKEAQSENKQIVQDISTSSSDNTLYKTAYGLGFADKTKTLYTFVLFNSETGEVLKTSNLDVIRNRTVYPIGAYFVAIAGKTTGNAGIRLILIDGKSLEMVKQSNEPVSAESVIASYDNNFFIIIQNGKKWAVGKYNANMELLAQSAIKVLETTPILVSENGVSIIDESNNARLLKLDDLSAVK